MKTKPSIPMMILRVAALYAVSYALYWGAAYLVGSPREFSDLWAKALTPVGVVAAAFYFNQTNPRRGK